MISLLYCRPAGEIDFHLSWLLESLPMIISEQYEYDHSQVVDGHQLYYSVYLMVGTLPKRKVYSP